MTYNFYHFYSYAFFCNCLLFFSFLFDLWLFYIFLFTSFPFFIFLFLCSFFALEDGVGTASHAWAANRDVRPARACRRA
jgi:hypothetical protein